MNEEDSDTEFSIPSEMVDKLYELSGGVDKYKGIIMAVSSDAGRPLIYQRFDCAMTELALLKALEASHMAPCHRFTWPWRFTIVGEKGIRLSAIRNLNLFKNFNF